MASDVLERFLALDNVDERIQFLNHRTPASRLALFEEWAGDPRLRAADLTALPMDFQVAAISFVCGNPHKGVPGTRPNFYVRPNAEWSPPAEFDDLAAKSIEDMRAVVHLENGSYNGRRRWVPITKETILPADKGVQAMLQYGPWAKDQLNRNRLVEISAQDYFAATGGKQFDAVRSDADARVAEAEAKAKAAMEEADRLRALVDSTSPKRKKK